MAEEQPKYAHPVKAETDTDALDVQPAVDPDADTGPHAKVDADAIVEETKQAPRKSILSKLKSIGNLGRTKSKGVPTEPPAPVSGTPTEVDEEPAAADVEAKEKNIEPTENNIELNEEKVEIDETITASTTAAAEVQAKVEVKKEGKAVKEGEAAPAAVEVEEEALQGTTATEKTAEESAAVKVEIKVEEKAAEETAASEEKVENTVVAEEQKSETAATVEDSHRESTNLESAPDPIEDTKPASLKAINFFPADTKVSVSVAMLDASVSQGGHPHYTIAVEVDGKTHENLGSVAGFRFAAFRALKTQLGRTANDGFPRTYIKNMFGIHLTAEQVSERATTLNTWLNAQLNADATEESLTALATFLKFPVANGKASVPVAPANEGGEISTGDATATTTPVKAVPLAAEPAAEPASPTQ